VRKGQMFVAQEKVRRKMLTMLMIGIAIGGVFVLILQSYK